MTFSGNSKMLNILTALPSLRVMKRVRGFTLLEILVVLFIAAILTTLLLSAVMSARNAAANIACSNNLRQLGIALNSYASSYNCFPSSMIVADAGIPARGNCFSVYTHVLAELDQQSLFNAVNFQVGQYPSGVKAENITASNYRLGVLICPADSLVSSTQGPIVSYRFNMGKSIDSFPTDLRSLGPFQLERWVTFCHPRWVF
jgi:prepilin-type N-terminal cleavage/methylation domain-containing protein